MGWFTKGDSGGKGNSKGGYEPSGSRGKPGYGYGKGSAATNPNKHKPRTEAQAKRADRKSDRWW